MRSWHERKKRALAGGWIAAAIFRWFSLSAVPCSLFPVPWFNAAAAFANGPSKDPPHRGRADAVQVVGLDGHSVHPFADAGTKGTVFVFVCTDCPVANRYAPDVERLYETYHTKRLGFWLVYADPREGPDKIRQHLKEFGYKIPALRDPEHRLVKLCGVAKTPEAALFAPDGTEVYRGRIDDRFTDYGKARAAPSREDLREAIEAVLNGKPVSVATTQVVGCRIPELRSGRKDEGGRSETRRGGMKDE
jgi:hypothetical protein